MTAIALLKFTQGARNGSPGHALIVETNGSFVNVSNGGDNTGVQSWRIELLDGPAGSTFECIPGAPTVLAQNPSDASPGYNFLPDVGFPGSYRIRLTVWTGTNYTGTSDVDVRNVSVRTSNNKIVLPPYQKLPDPLPLPPTGLPGAKPDELNFEGQPWGWSGPDYAHPVYGQSFVQFRLLNAALNLLDSGGGGGGGGSLTTRDKAGNPSATAGDQQATGIILDEQPAPNGAGTDEGYVAVFVNGVQYDVGDGSNASQPCYFGPNAATARALDEIQVGDQLFWNDSVAGFSLSLSDVVTLVYSVGGGVGGGYQTVQYLGAPLPQQTVLNFIGAGVTVLNDVPNNRTVVNIPGGGGGGASSVGTGVLNAANGIGGWNGTLVQHTATPNVLEQLRIPLPVGDPVTASFIVGDIGSAVRLTSNKVGVNTTSSLSFDANGLVSAATALRLASASLVLDVNGVPFTWPTADGAANTFLQTDGAGNLSFAAVSAGLKYTVGAPVSGANYATIQAAINAAVTDGASYLTPAEIFITPGYYPENLSLSGGGLVLRGIGNEWGVYIDGTITINNAPVDNLWVLDSIGVNGLVSFVGSAAGSFGVETSNCKFFYRMVFADATNLVLHDTGSVFRDNGVVVDNVIAFTTGVPAYLSLQSTELYTNTANICVTGPVFARNTTFLGRVVLTGAIAGLYQSVVYANVIPIDDQTTSICELYDVAIHTNTASSPSFRKTGVGLTNYGGLTFNDLAVAPFIQISAGTTRPGHAQLAGIVNQGASWIWPNADGAVNAFLQTDGAGNLSFAAAPATLSVGPVGAIQYSDGSGAFLGTANATLNNTGDLSAVTVTTTGDGSIGGDLNVTGKLTVGGLIDPTGLVLEEQAANPWTPVAGSAALWVRDDSPNILMFTDDLGTDFVVGLDVVPGGVDRSIQFNNAGAFDGSAYLLFDGAVNPTPASFKTLSLKQNVLNGSALFIVENFGSATPVAYFGTNGTQTLLNGGTQPLLITSNSVTHRWPLAAGSVGQVLTSDGAGNINWASSAATVQTTAGGLANADTITPTTAVSGAITIDLPFIQFSDSSLKVLVGPSAGLALSDVDSRTVVFGASNLLATTGAVVTDSEFFGVELASAKTAAITESVFVGRAISNSGTTGAVNRSVLIGHQIASGTTSSLNDVVFIGKNAGPAGVGNVIGARVIAIGVEAFTAINSTNTAESIAIGYKAGVAKTNAERTVLVGASTAGGPPSAITDVTAVGDHALAALGGGAKLTAFGAYALPVMSGGGQLVGIGPFVAPVLNGAGDAILMHPGKGGGGGFPLLAGGGGFILLGTASSFDAITSTGNVIGIGIGNGFNAVTNFTGSTAIGQGGGAGLVGITAGSQVLSSGNFGNTSVTLQNSILIGNSTNNLINATGQTLDSCIFIGGAIGGSITVQSVNDVVLIGQNTDVPTAAPLNGYIGLKNALCIDTNGSHEAEKFGLGYQAITNVIGQRYFGRLSQNKVGLAADLTPILGLVASGASNAADVGIFAGDRNPNGAVTGSPGDLYIRSSGTGSRLYQHRDASSSTNWHNIGGTPTLQDVYDTGPGPNAGLLALTAAQGAFILNSGVEAVSPLRVQDNSVDVLAVNAAGAVTVTPTSGQNFSATAAGAGTSSIASATTGVTAGASLVLDGGTTPLTWPSADGTAGQTLVTNGAGVLSFASAASAPTELVATASSNISPSAATLQANVITYACDVSGGGFTVTLPSGCANGTKVRVKDAHNGGTQAGTPANNITVAASGGETIDGLASTIVATNYGSVTLVKGTGTDWHIV
jgi:hypothetical protein